MQDMEGQTNRGFAVQDENKLQTHDVSVSVSSATQNVEDNPPDEYHVGISDEQCVKCTCPRKTTLLKPGMSDNNGEFTEEKSLMSNETPSKEQEVTKESKTETEGRRFWYCNLSAWRSTAHHVFKWMVHACVVVYVIFAIRYWKLKDDCNFAWCDGLGMLIIIVTLVYCGLLYYFIIKKHFGKNLYNNVLKPIYKYSNIVLEHRYGKIVMFSLPFIAIVVFLIVDTIGSTERLVSCFGTVVIISLGFLFSKHRTQIQWYPVLSGLVIQFLLGLITIRWSIGRNIFQCFGDRVAIFLGYSNEGAKFVYGRDLIDKGVFAFQALSAIFFLSFVVQILYYYGIMQLVVIKMGWLIQVLMGTTVCESVNAAASVFFGMAEAPLLFRPYIKDLTKSEMHAVMTGGFATVAGAVLAAYISFGISPAHLVTASVMSAPAALCFSKLFYPETEESMNKAQNMIIEKGDESSVMEAATKGATTAIQLVLGIIANIIAFVSFIAFLNGILSWLGILVGAHGITFEYIMSTVFIPLAWVMGVEWQQCEAVAHLIGVKTIVNEFIAYEQLGKLKSANQLSPRSEMIATYALCGFSNPGSIGISIGTLTTLAPSQKNIINEVAFRAFIAGSATCFLTACIAGTLMPDDYFPNDSVPAFNASLQVP